MLTFFLLFPTMKNNYVQCHWNRLSLQMEEHWFLMKFQKAWLLVWMKMCPARFPIALFKKKKKFLPQETICLPLLKKLNGSDSHGFTFRRLNFQETLRTYPFIHILKMRVKDGWFALQNFLLYVLCLYVLTTNCTSGLSYYDILVGGLKPILLLLATF